MVGEGGGEGDTFQFYKVRLKLLRFHVDVERVQFQFYKVRLKHVVLLSM